MRKYISIFVIAIVALCATSCKLESGSNPNPNKANDLLWHRVYSALDGQSQLIKVIAHLNDTMCNMDYPIKAYDACIITKLDETFYTLEYSSQNITYKVNTVGKRLDEGGEWILYVKYGSYMEFTKVGIICGVAGEATKFSISTDNEGVYHSDWRNTMQSEVEYSYDKVENCLNITFSKVKGFSTDFYSDNSQTDYIIEFDATEPMVFYGTELYSGRVNVLYKDNILHTTRTLTVVIANKIVTFATQN